MSSLVESWHDASDAAATDRGTPRSAASMSAARHHGRLPPTSRAVAAAMSGLASTAAACRVIASSSSLLSSTGDHIVQQRVLPPSRTFADASSSSPRSLPKPDSADHPDIREQPTGASDAEPQSGSRDTGSGNPPPAIDGNDAAGALRSRFAFDAASNDVKLERVDGDRTSRGDCYLPAGGSGIDAATDRASAGNWNNDNDERTNVFDAEQTVDARHQQRVDNSFQRCDRAEPRTCCLAAGRWHYQPKRELADDGDVDVSPTAARSVFKDEVPRDDELQPNGSEDDVDSVALYHFKPSTTASQLSLSSPSQNHLAPTFSDTRPWSYGGSVSDDVISAKLAGARDLTVHKNGLCRFITVHISVTFTFVFFPPVSSTACQPSGIA